MASMRETHSVILLGTAALGLLWAGCGEEINRPVIEDKHETCVTSDQCPSGEVCKEGLCIIGDCVVRTDCPTSRAPASTATAVATPATTARFVRQ